jgi:hypothetical protein
MALATCNARLKSDPSKRCRKLVVPGRNRCRLHGGLSTGPRTAEGMARGIEAMRAGYAGWVEARRAAGLPTFGRPKGATNLSTRRYEAALAQWQAASASYDQDRDAHAAAVYAATLAKNKHVRASVRGGGTRPRAAHLPALATAAQAERLQDTEETAREETVAKPSDVSAHSSINVNACS